MALTTVKSIENALNLVESKKQNLKKAFEELQSRSHLLASFNLTWPELDSYFKSLQLELLDSFSTLQTLELSRNPKPETKKDSILPNPVPARAELRSLCENMDGLGLRKYIVERPKDRIAIRAELVDALKNAQDPGSVVLDALDGFWEEDLSVGSKIRTACVVMLEELMRAGVEIGGGVRERARAVAMEWKGKVAVGAGNGVEDGDEGEREEERGLERLGYLLLLAAYKLVDGSGAWDASELTDHVFAIARYRQAVELCRNLGLQSGISDVVQRLIGKGKQLVALRFILQFGLMDEFPPVPLMKVYVMDSKKNAQKVHKSGKNYRRSLNEAATKEISDLKMVIKCIKDCNLESQYPKDELLKRIETLEKEKADRKRPLPTPVLKPKQNANKLKQNGNKRMKTVAGPSKFIRKPDTHSGLLPPHINRAGLLPDLAAAYLSAPAGAHGIAGSHAAGAPYVGSSVDGYGLSGGPLGFPGNLNPSASNSYPSETHARTVYHDNRAMAYGGYDVPSQYHPAYYPQ